MTQTNEQIKEFKAKEDFNAGVFYAHEIFKLQQEKLILQTQYDLRKNRISRIESGF